MPQGLAAEPTRGDAPRDANARPSTADPPPDAGAVTLLDKWAFLRSARKVRHGKKSLAERDLLETLLDMAGVGGRAPDRAGSTLGVLATECDVSKSSVQRAIEGLVGAGLIACNSSPGVKGGLEFRIIGLAGAHTRLERPRWRDGTKDRKQADARSETYPPAGRFEGPGHGGNLPAGGTQTYPPAERKPTRRRVPNPPIEASENKPPIPPPLSPPPAAAVEPQDGADAPVVVGEIAPSALGHSLGQVSEEVISRLAERSREPKETVRQKVADMVHRLVAVTGMAMHAAGVLVQTTLREGLDTAGVDRPIQWADGKLNRQANERRKAEVEGTVRATSDPELERAWRLYGPQLAREMLGDERPLDECKLDPQFCAYLNGHDVRDRIAQMGDVGMANWLVMSALDRMEDGHLGDPPSHHDGPTIEHNPGEQL